MFTTEYFGLYVQATPPAPTLTGAELVPVIISGVTNNTTTQQIRDLAPTATTLPNVVASNGAGIPISAGTGGPSSVSTSTSVTGGNMATLLVAIINNNTDATAVLTPTLTLGNAGGPSTIILPTFTIATVKPQSYAYSFRSDGINPTSVTITWVTAAGTGGIKVDIRLIDNGP